MGVIVPSAAYSIATGLVRSVPLAKGTRDSPSVQGITASIDMPARSQSVGVRSMVETGVVTRPGVRPGAEIIKGTRAAPSKKFILNHSPLRPSISP